jgi:ketosteroid isomerase-like protein
VALLPVLALLAAAPIDWTTTPQLPRGVSATSVPGAASNLPAIRNAADALARGDAAPLTALLHASATWTAAPSNAFTRTTQLDRRGAQSYLSMMASAIRNGTARLTVLSATRQGNDIVVTSNWGSNRQQCSTLVRVVNGSIVQVVEQGA